MSCTGVLPTCIWFLGLFNWLFGRWGIGKLARAKLGRFRKIVTRMLNNRVYTVSQDVEALVKEKGTSFPLQRPKVQLATVETPPGPFTKEIVSHLDGQLLRVLMDDNSRSAFFAETVTNVGDRGYYLFVPCF